MAHNSDFVDLDAFKVANILACLPPQLRQQLICALQRQRPNIGYLTMRFEDLKQVDDDAIKSLIEQVSPSNLALALATADRQLIERFCDNMAVQDKERFSDEIERLQRQQDQECFFDAFDAKIEVISTAARLRETGEISLSVSEQALDEVPETMVSDIEKELQLASEKAMAQVLACCLPEAAAAVLSQRGDTERILQQMLQLDSNDFNDSLSDEQINQLLSGIVDHNVF